MKFIVIPGKCCNPVCNRAAMFAERFSDGWISFCAECRGKRIDLNAKALNRIIAAQKKNADLKGQLK